jgi:hypothetical protein
VPNWSHLWQRFLLTSSLLVGLAIGVAATIFGYSNLSTVNVHWSVLHIDGIPLWTVAVVPLALTLIAGTLYHWMDSLHHFSEHMRHRHRVHELEAEVAALRSHLDQVLEMPDHAGLAAKGAKVSLPQPVEVSPDPGPFGADTTEAPALPEATPEPPPQKSGGDRRKRVKLTVAPEPEVAKPNGEQSTPAPVAEEPAEPAIPAIPAQGA